MSRSRGRAPSHTLELLVPYQRVALRVISQAFRDLERPRESRAARAFLAGSAMLSHWCALADLDAAKISATAQVLAARDEGGGRRPARSGANGRTFGAPESC